jgi:hypothetical protein
VLGCAEFSISRCVDDHGRRVAHHVGGVFCIRCGPQGPNFIGDIAAIVLGVVSVVFSIADLIPGSNQPSWRDMPTAISQ